MDFSNFNNWKYKIRVEIAEENMADENEQLDEIMALQSIYEDGTFICNISDKPITGNISITIETDADELGFTCNGYDLNIVLNVIRIF